MYKMSTVYYVLSNGNTVNTLEEARAAKIPFRVEYQTIYEESVISKKAEAARRKL